MITCQLYDLVVVGAGPVGVAGALEAARLLEKKRVALVDAGPSFGLPSGFFSKTLRAASVRMNIPTLSRMDDADDLIWREIAEQSNDTLEASSKRALREVIAAGIDFISGFASFGKTNHTLNISKGPLNATIFGHNILLATGSKPVRLPQSSSSSFEGKRIFDSDSIKDLSHLPQSIAICGCGVIAIEHASIFRQLGVAVVLLVRKPKPLDSLLKMGLDHAVAAKLLEALLQSGVHIVSGFTVENLHFPCDTNDPIRVDLVVSTIDTLKKRKKTVTRKSVFCDIYLTAVGRTPFTKGLQLPSAVRRSTHDGAIEVLDPEQQRTSVPHIYAAGDVCGGPYLVSIGCAQAETAVRCMFHKQQHFPSCMRRIALRPRCIWTFPEVAWCGMTSQSANAIAGLKFGESQAQYSASSRGAITHATGSLKLVFELPSLQILGVHIIGATACELIHFGMELVREGHCLQRLAHETVFSAVTFHELYKLAAVAGLKTTSEQSQSNGVCFPSSCQP